MGNPSTASESVHPAELLKKVEADGSLLLTKLVQWRVQVRHERWFFHEN